MTGGLPPQRGSNAGNVRWRHHVQYNKAKVMKIFDGWSSEPRSRTSTSDARMAAESGWSLGTRHVDKPWTSLHPSLQWQERITFRRWLNNTHPTYKHKGQGYGVIIISPVHCKGGEMPIISNRHWFRQWLGAEGNKPSPETLLKNMIIVHRANSRQNDSRCFLTKIWYDTYSKHMRIQQYGFIRPVPGETIPGVS